MTTHLTRLSKWLLAADLALCGVWLIVDTYIFYDPYMMLFPMLRIWLSFLTFDRSRLTWCPMGLLAVMNLTLLRPYAPIYDLYVAPIVKIVRCCISLYGGTGAVVDEFLHSWFSEGYLCFKLTMLLVWLVGFVWFVGIPLAIYLRRAARKLLVSSALSRKQSRWLFGYMLVVVTLFSTRFFDTFGFYEKLAAGALPVLLAPVLFCKGSAKPLLTKEQTTALSIMALITVGFIVGAVMEEKSILTTLTIPVAVYALINRYVSRKTPYWEYLLLAVAMFCFWQAQNTIDGVRIALLGLSVAVVAFVAIRFIRSTRLYAAGVILFAAVAVIIPVMCIGYNPYVVLSAKRSRVCTDYLSSPSGLLYVRGNNGSGIRDRYGVILPAEYDRIRIMVPYRPYFMVQKGNKWRIYDIVRHEFITDESYDEIVPSGADMFMMSNEKDYLLEFSVPYSKSRQSFRIIPLDDEESNPTICPTSCSMRY